MGIYPVRRAVFASHGASGTPFCVHRLARGTNPEVLTQIRRVAFLLCLLVLAPACARETIAHQQTEPDANLIMVYLNRAGIDSDKLKDESSRDLRFNVTVQKSQANEAFEVLHKYNLPKTPAPDSEKMFSEAAMIPTPEQQRAKREVGIRGDIINSLRSVPRVVDVQAVVTIPEDNPLRDPNEAKARPKASVLLTYLEDSEGRPPVTPEDVQRYVQASLPDIKSSEVGVNMFPAEGLGKVGSAGMAMVDPNKGCMEKERVIGIEVCAGSRQKVHNLVLGSVSVAGVLSSMVIFAVLRAMRYRKDLTRLTAQFERVKSK